VLDATDLMAWFNHGGGSALIDGLAQDLDVAVVPFGHAGTAKLWFADERPGPLAGRTVAVSGTGKAVARGLGASLRDATEFGPAPAAVVEASPLEVVTGGLLGHVRSVVDAAVTPRGTTLSLVFARPAWDRLPPDLQRAIQHTGERHYADAVAEDRAHAEDILHGLVIDGFALTGRLQRGSGADVEIGTIEAVAAAVIADVASGTPQARRIAASYDRFAALRRGLISYAAA
jgi:TRAP-type mannitol/chloroaromatic compound transport system substrate-binding protein